MNNTVAHALVRAAPPLLATPGGTSRTPWFIYAMGGGWGHLTRAAALARAAHRHRPVRILCNSPYAALVRNRFPELDIISLDPAISVTAARHQVAHQVQLSNPGCLIVDTFARGLGGEIVDLLKTFPGTKVLVQRDLNPQYTASAGLPAFIASQYDVVLAPGEAVEGLPQAIVTAPWLIRSDHELLPLDQARQILRLEPDQPCVIVCAAGNPDELEWYGAVVSQLLALDAKLSVRCIAPTCPRGCPPECWISYWPAMDLYRAASVVIGGAGYNTVHECEACGIPLIARPWPRKYDRQAVRAARASNITVQEPREAAIAALRQISHAPRQPPTEFPNGTEEAYSLLAPRRP
jgi:hypothetical protein